MFQEGLMCRSRLDARFTLKGSKPQYAPDRAFDTEHIRLDVKLDIAKKTLSGVCDTRLRALRDGVDAMVFDAVKFKVSSVKTGGKAVAYDYDGDKLTVRFPKALRAGARVEVSIAYSVSNPPLGLYFIGPDKDYPDKPVQVWTQGEDEFARYWFPCHDAPQDRTTTEMIARVPKGFTAISNGRLVKKTAGRGVDVFHWKQDIPHATYLVTLAVGRFSEIKDKWNNILVLYYCEKGREDDARRAFGNTPKMMEFFSKNIGVPYAYEKYAQVAAEDFIFGGMENTSATTQTAMTLHDERAHIDFSSDPLVAHELAHQWFGDLLTCRDWPHAWLNESFATYFEALFKEHDKGRDEFVYEMRQNALSYFDEDKEHYRRAIVTNVYKLPSDIFDRHLYEKGACVLHMLRYVLGDKDFWRAIRTYVEDNRGKTVETADLAHAIRKATGVNPDRFLDEWVKRPGHPEFAVRYWWDARKGEANVRVAQTQGGDQPYTSVPVEIAFLTASGEKRFKEKLSAKSHLFKFKLGSEPEGVLFDPDHKILKRVDFPKSESQWIAQLRRDQNPLGRMDAADALGGLGTKAAVDALKRALLDDKFWAVQGHAAKALGAIKTAEASEALLAANEKVRHPKARRFLLAALGGLAHPAARSLLADGADREDSYYAEVETVKSLARLGDERARGLAEARLNRPSWNDVLAVGALDALAFFGGDDVLAELKSRARRGNSYTVRAAAIRGLAKLGAGRDDVRRLLESLAHDPYLLLQMAAVRALVQIGDERSAAALKDLTGGHRDGRLKRMAEEAIEKLKKPAEGEEKPKDAKPGAKRRR